MSKHGTKKRWKCRLGFHEYHKIDEGAVTLAHAIPKLSGEPFILGEEPSWTWVEECQFCGKRRAFAHSFAKGDIQVSAGQVLSVLETLRYRPVDRLIEEDGVDPMYRGKIIAYLKIVEGSKKTPEEKKKWQEEYFEHCRKEFTTEAMEARYKE